MGPVGDHTLTVEGEVARPLRIRLSDLTELGDGDVRIDFHCHEGWSRSGQRYRGVTLAALLALAHTRADARYVTIASGEYTVVLPRKQAEDPRVLLAHELDGRSLSAARLVGPSEWDCFLSVKNVDRIELTRDEPQATARAIALGRIGRS